MEMTEQIPLKRDHWKLSSLKKKEKKTDFKNLIGYLRTVQNFKKSNTWVIGIPRV
jgi:hypothetical protein